MQQKAKDIERLEIKHGKKIEHEHAEKRNTV